MSRFTKAATGEKRTIEDDGGETKRDPKRVKLTTETKEEGGEEESKGEEKKTKKTAPTTKKKPLPTLSSSFGDPTQEISLGDWRTFAEAAIDPTDPKTADTVKKWEQRCASIRVMVNDSVMFADKPEMKALLATFYKALNQKPLGPPQKTKRKGTHPPRCCLTNHALQLAVLKLVHLKHSSSNDSSTSGGDNVVDETEDGDHDQPGVIVLNSRYEWFVPSLVVVLNADSYLHRNFEKTNGAKTATDDERAMAWNNYRAEARLAYNGALKFLLTVIRTPPMVP